MYGPRVSANKSNDLSMQARRSQSVVLLIVRRRYTAPFTAPGDFHMQGLPFKHLGGERHRAWRPLTKLPCERVSSCIPARRKTEDARNRRNAEKEYRYLTGCRLTRRKSTKTSISSVPKIPRFFPSQTKGVHHETSSQRAALTHYLQINVFIIRKEY